MDQQPKNDPAAEFLLDLSWENGFEPASAAPNNSKFRCKICGIELARSRRQDHFTNHRNERGATMAKNDETEKVAKPKKATAKDLGVPAAYLGDTGTFRPGMDARLKSDLINAICGQPNDNALVPWTKANAEKLLEKFPHWRGFLLRKQEIIETKAVKAEEKAKAKEAAAKEKADAKAAADAEKAAAKEPVAA